MGKGDDWGFALALLLGLAGLAMLAKGTSRCPACNQIVTKNVQSCPHCGTPLSW